MAEQEEKPVVNEPIGDGGKLPSRQGLYSKVALHVPKAIDVLVKLLDSRNEAIRIGAAKELINKCLPDVRAIEVSGENSGPLLIRIVREQYGIRSGDQTPDRELPQTAGDIQPSGQV